MDRDTTNRALLAVMEVLGGVDFAPEGIVVAGLQEGLGVSFHDAAATVTLGAFAGLWDRLHHTLRITVAGREMLEKARAFEAVKREVR